MFISIFEPRGIIWEHILNSSNAMYLNTKSLGALRALTSILAGGPSGLSTSSFAPFGRSGHLTHATVIG